LAQPNSKGPRSFPNRAYMYRWLPDIAHFESFFFAAGGAGCGCVRMLYPHQCNTVAAIAGSLRETAETELVYLTMDAP
jgi:hypothetical protein